ncbi:MAG: glycoside hydrolase N-terminal domain-containing protein, partial [Clostridia bacterium]
PLPLCVLRVKMNNSEAVCDYSRQLNMATGEATVSYTCGNTRVERNLFASRDKNMVVYQITKVGSETLNFEIDYELIHRINSRTPDGVSIMPDVVETQYDKTFMRFAGRNESGTDYGAVAKLNVNGGIVKPTSEGITVIGANSALITVMMFIEGNRTKEWASLQSELIAIKDSYDKLLRAHANIHGKLYNAVSLSLSTTPDEYVEDLIAKTNSGNIPAKLFEKMYNFGRYLMISAYSEGGRLLSPCGLWNGSYKAYKSFISSYGVLQTVYLSALNSNMPYAVESLFNYYEKFIGDFKDNAIRIFGCNGIFVPAIISPNTGRVGSTSVTVLNFTASAAWLSLLFFKYYERTGNIKFLKRLLPFMKETANFYEDFFKKSADGSYIISPSCLPMAPEDEVKQKDRPVISKNSALDFQIARNFFRALIKASADGKMYQRDVDRWREIASNLPENQTNSEGYFKEFINCMVAMDYTGISNGTLFGAYFGNDINFLSRKETSELYILTADHKLNNAGKETSFNMAVLASVYARLEQTEKAETCLTNVIRGCAMNNLALTEKDWRGMGVCGSGVWIPTQLQSNIAVTN